MAARACPSCGTAVNLEPNFANSLRCSSCGHTFAAQTDANTERSAQAAEEPTPTSLPAGRKPLRRRAAEILLAIIVVLLIAHVIYVFRSVFSPYQGLGKRAYCAANLTSIGKALAIYTNLYDGHLPPSIDILVTQDLVQPAQLFCPATNPPGDAGREINAYILDRSISPRLHEILQSCYVYIPGQDSSSDPGNVLVYEKKDCHPHDGGHILSADSHAEWVAPYAKVEDLVAQTKQRLAAASKRARKVDSRQTDPLRPVSPAEMEQRVRRR